jgi:hypothetical protein
MREGVGFGDLEGGVAGGARGGAEENDLDGREMEGVCYIFPVPKIFSLCVLCCKLQLDILYMGRCMFQIYAKQDLPLHEKSTAKAF